MTTTEEYEQELLKALIHLNDPAYRPSEALYRLINCSPKDGVLTFEVTLLRTIEDLKPQTDVPSTTETQLLYDLLHKRFVEKLTQEETAEHLHVGRTSIHRLQLKAVHVLSRMLWGRAHPEGSVTESRFDQERDEEPGKELLNSQAAHWKSQVRYELASLEKLAPRSASNVGEVIANVQELITVLSSQMGFQFEVNSLQQDLVADVHPSILSQILIVVLERLARYGTNGQIILNARLDEKVVKIELIRTNPIEIKNIEKEFITDIIIPKGVLIEACLNDNRVTVSIQLPSADKVTVLVVDDNPDIALLYRRSTEKTKYHIVHIRKGQELFDAIEAGKPDVIVLDIVLPDVDGWHLLMRLNQNPATQSIPVIICSVVRDEALAMSLGAELCLSKPVRSKQFLQALDQVMNKNFPENIPSNF